MRSISQHVKEQNWTAIVVDFVIVVVGVFMGIQVSNWNESQREQTLLRDYLHRLNEDFALSITGTERTREFLTTNQDNLGIVLNSLRDCAVASEQRDEFANGLFHMGKLIPAQFVDGTLEELRASGRLLLVKNDGLRDAINETVREHEYQARVWPAIQRRAGNSRAYITDSHIFWLERPVNGFSNVSWNELEIDLLQVCKDRVLLSRVSDLHRTSFTIIAWLDRNLNNFRTVKQFLDVELDRQGVE
jgi:hypothetical protein